MHKCECTLLADRIQNSNDSNNLSNLRGRCLFRIAKLVYMLSGSYRLIHYADRFKRTPSLVIVEAATTAAIAAIASAAATAVCARSCPANRDAHISRAHLARLSPPGFRDPVELITLEAQPHSAVHHAALINCPLNHQQLNSL
jgi:hypothetical protein